MSWIKYAISEETNVILEDLTKALALRGGPLSEELHNLVMSKDYLGVINYQFDYSKGELEDFVYARQIQALFSKRPDLNLGLDLEKLTLDLFLASERQCAETNRRFRIRARENPDVESVIYLAQRKIAEILGDVPSLSELRCSFGPGTNTSTKRKRANPRIKLSSRLECSTNLLPFAEAFLLETAYSWGAHHKFRATPAAGRLAFVPKTSKIYRSVIIEPILSGFGQKGIGRHIRKRLEKWGLDLRNQKLNQQYAMKGSVDGSLATVDLASASDTIAYGLVLELLPPEWFNFLEVFRTSSVVLPSGRVIELQKFSSMGNAYTFELESLIFYALAYSCCVLSFSSVEHVRSYGDDIIVPVTAVPLLERVLDYCGFTINKKKSYAEGPFRESCGADYLNGFDIRPFYLKSQINNRVLFSMYNWFVRHCEFEIASVVLRYIPAHIRLWGPDGYGDGHLIGDYHLRRSRKGKRAGWEGGVFDTYSLKPRYNRKLYPGDYVYPSYSTYVHEIGEHDELWRSDVQVSFCGQGDHDVIPGTAGYHRISIYTLTRTIFARLHPDT